ncbi:uncharacterized protein B0P05DRAFT_600452 [Gilbertella persicaria]|uniref:uncharacterized protein n=1 Tax=Gilbertella persicaria TaxID=101096 RepID=UPI0022207F4F|nr:uncharacterized protein B0P05DRAFT_600452 [Gilbertella persicaria]KAI8051908.1 hypothetical protein B0P05DRAFT_600452 [Gilbertella persicaria]
MSRLLYSRRRGHDSEGEYASEGEGSAVSYNSSDSEHSDVSSSYCSESEESDLDEAETEGSGEESEEEEQPEQEEPLIKLQQPATVVKEQKAEHKEIIDYQQVNDTPQATHDYQHQETAAYQDQPEDSGKRFQEHREYRRKLAEDPSFVPYVGLFWGHDDRYREDLLTEARPDGSQPRFSSNNNHNAGAQDYNRQLDPLMYKKWDHSGYEELLRMDEEDERRKRTLIEEGKVEEANNYRPNRVPYNNYSRGPKYGRGGYHNNNNNNNNNRPPRQNHRQHGEWPELSKNDETQNKWSTEQEKSVITDNSREQISTVKKDSNDWKSTIVDSNKIDDWTKEHASTESNKWGESSAPALEKNDWNSSVNVASTDSWDTQAKTSDWSKTNDNQKQEVTSNGWNTTNNNNNSSWADTPIETTHKEKWNSKERGHSDIPTEEKASASWTTYTVEEIQVPTTPSKWTMRNNNNRTDRRNRFNNDSSSSFRHSKPRRDNQKQDKPWKSRNPEKETTDQEWNTNKWNTNKWNTSSTTPADTQGWGEPSSKSNDWNKSTSFDADTWGDTAIDSKESTSNGWDKPDDINGSSDKPNDVTPTETSEWNEPTTSKHETDSWNAPDTKSPVPSTKVEIEVEGWGAPTIHRPNENVWSEATWGSSNKSVSESEPTQRNSSSSWTAKPENVGWGQVDTTNQSNDSSSGWGQESESWSRQEKSHQHRRGRGYLSQKIENEATTTNTTNTTNTTISFHAEQEQKESGWGSLHNTGNEDSDVEIILEAEEEPEWLQQEQVLGMIAPGDADTSSQSPRVLSSSSVENSPRRHHHHHHHQANHSPHFDSRKPRQNKPRRQLDENWRRRKEDQPPVQQQPTPMYYSTPQHMNGANIAYVPMIPNANYFHMGGNVQPSTEGANTNKFYGPLPPGFEANGMVYYGVDPNLYPPQQPFYYYVPMNGNVGSSSLVYDKSTSPNEPQAGEDEDEGWGPSPDIHEGEEQWNSHNDRGHKHQPPSNAVNYNNSLYYYYPQQPQNHF